MKDCIPGSRIIQWKTVSPDQDKANERLYPLIKNKPMEDCIPKMKPMKDVLPK